MPISAVLLLLAAAALPSAAGTPQLLLTIDGENTDDQFGIAVAGAGDVTGSFYPDFVIGASLSDDAGQSAGKVQIFAGGPVLTSAPAFELFGQPGDLFGDAVAGVGDVTGDGHPDILVGARLSDEAGLNAGKIYLFEGGPALDGVADLVVHGQAEGDRFGEAVASAGDLNGDGWGDFAAGMPRSGNGKVHVFFGGAVLDTIPDLVLRGESDGDRFGTSVASVGDVDGDAFDDLLVGAPRYSAGATWRGAAYLFLGGGALDSVPDLRFTGEAAGDAFGAWVAGDGQLGGSGAPDILVGAPDANVGASVDAGKAYIFFGGSGLDIVPDLSLNGPSASAQFGVVLVAGGDIDGDGEEDFAIGAPGFDANLGAIYMYRGGAALDAGPDFTFSGESADDRYGAALAAIADVNYNLADDVLVGAWGAGIGGRAYVLGDSSTAVGVAASAAPSPPALSVYPHPMRGRGVIRLALERSAIVSLTVFDVAGRGVAVDPPRNMTPGEHIWSWPLPGSAASPGVYYLLLDAGEHSIRRRIVVTR